MLKPFHKKTLNLFFENAFSWKMRHHLHYFSLLSFGYWEYFHQISSDDKFWRATFSKFWTVHNRISVSWLLDFLLTCDRLEGMNIKRLGNFPVDVGETSQRKISQRNFRKLRTEVHGSSSNFQENLSNLHRNFEQLHRMFEQLPNGNLSNSRTKIWATCELKFEQIS